MFDVWNFGALGERDWGVAVRDMEKGGRKRRDGRGSLADLFNIRGRRMKNEEHLEHFTDLVLIV